MRVISIFTIDPKKAGNKPSQEQFEKIGALIAEVVGGDGTCTIHEVSTV